MRKIRKTSENRGRAVTGVCIAGAAAAAVGALSYALTGKLMQVALDRDGVKPSPYEERVRNRLCGFENQDAFLEEMESAAEKLAAVETESVEITGHDGTKLIGHFYPCEKPERIIIAMHGWRSSWNRDFGMAVDFWHDNNCSVLFAEQRGQGMSEGEYMGFGMIERYDCLEWAKWADRRAEEMYGGKLPVFLHGISMGAATVLMAAGLELPESVKGIIADSGYTSPYDIWKHVTEHHFHLAYGPIGVIADAICRRKIQMGSEDCSVADAMETNRIPVLFVHGTDDPFVPVEMTYENYKACKVPKRLVIVPGAAHGMSYYVERERCQAEMMKFWRDFA